MLGSVYYKRFLLFFCFLFLAQCAKSPEQFNASDNGLPSAYPLPAEQYLAKAQETTGESRQMALIQAAGRLIDDGHWRQGQRLLQQVRPTSLSLQQEKSLLLAKVAMVQDKPKQATKRLASIYEKDSLSSPNQSRYHLLLAEAYNLSNKTVQSVAERVKLQKILQSRQAQIDNAQALWLTLNKLPSSEIAVLKSESESGSDMKGWLDLAALSQLDSSEQIASELVKWQMIYPNHPGHLIVRKDASLNELSKRPTHIAVLLPLDGNLKGPAEAIKDGMEAAAKANKDKFVKLAFYNTDNHNIAALYREAIQKGADCVVGPLDKQNVAELSHQSHPVPTILLNESHATHQDNIYQLALSPEQEAMQIAAVAQAKGLKKALLIAPADPWGEGVVSQFLTTYQAAGGQVVGSYRYGMQDDFNHKLRDFLKVSDSQSRINDLKQVLGKNFESTPRRRQDFDMIFLLAYPSKARQVMPLLRYYYAGNIPVYATSTSYNATTDPMKNKDLDGLIFTDMPAVFAADIQPSYWPESLNAYNRLYSLGWDAFYVTQSLSQLQLFTSVKLNDRSGSVHIEDGGVIARHQALGKIHQGKAQRLS